MNPTCDRTDLPVLMLYNLDYTWAIEEIEEGLSELVELQSAMQKLGHPIIPVPIYSADLNTPLRNYQPDDYIVFNWCEGFPGLPNSYEKVAQALESLSFVYTGSASHALALNQDKRKVKKMLTAGGIPTPQWHTCETAQPNGWDRFPAIVKPAQEHCSLGVDPEAVVMTHEELYRRIAYVIDTFHQPALVEDFIDGREFHVSLWGNGTIQMLPPAEMDFSAFGDVHDRLCTYSSKFDPTSIHYNQIKLSLPAPLDQDEYRLLEQTSIAAYHSCGCRDYARLDIRLRDGVFYILDVNHNPDIYSGSSLACSAEVAGYSYGAMGSHIVNLAALRHPRLRPVD